MDYQKRISRALEFIEGNLGQPISLDDVSKQAFSSLSYLHRVFFFATGFTVKEYIRRRRLDRAATLLKEGKHKVIDIALACQFQSAESFSRAFKKGYGMSPTAFKQGQEEYTLFKSWAMDQVQFSTNDPAIEIEQSFVFFNRTSVMGFCMQTSLDNNRHQQDIPSHAGRTFTTLNIGEYFHLAQSPTYGVYTNMTEQDEFDYTLGCERDALTAKGKEESAVLVRHILPGKEYAKFRLHSLDKAGEAWAYIYGYWIPHHHKRRTAGFDFEVYSEKYTDIYIPMNQFKEV